MKYGVVVYKESRNIGDDIQSYAAARLLPHVDYYIEREHLDVFRPQDPEPVSVILNGWFMYNKLGWPISYYINPLYLSMHFNAEDALEVNDLFLHGLGSEDLLEHAPIGCRDQETSRFLQKAGIPTWLSGCVTLTLSPIGEKSVQPYVCLVNVSAQVEEYVRQTYPDLDIRVISQESEDPIDPASSFEQRLQNAADWLQVYQNARAVITTRLHCAMPCLALQTPVLLLSDHGIEEKGRFDGLSELATHASTEDFVNGHVAFDLNAPPANPPHYLALRNELLAKIQAFVKESQDEAIQKSLESRIARYDSEWERRALWKDEIFGELQARAVRRWNENHQTIETLYLSREELYENKKALWQENEMLRHENEILRQRLQKIRHPLRTVLHKIFRSSQK